MALATGFPRFAGRCINADCSSGFIDRNVVSGSVVGRAVAVPEPATLAIVVLGLLGLAAKRKRFKPHGGTAPATTQRQRGSGQAAAMGSAQFLRASANRQPATIGSASNSARAAAMSGALRIMPLSA